MYMFLLQSKIVQCEHEQLTFQTTQRQTCNIIYKEEDYR